MLEKCWIEAVGSEESKKDVIVKKRIYILVWMARNFKISHLFIIRYIDSKVCLKHQKTFYKLLVNFFSITIIAIRRYEKKFQIRSCMFIK